MRVLRASSAAAGAILLLAAQCAGLAKLDRRTVVGGLAWGCAEIVGVKASELSSAEAAYAETKASIFAEAFAGLGGGTPSILELGIGREGPNLGFYPAQSRVLGVDPRLGRPAKALLANAEKAAVRLELKQGVGESLDGVGDGAFDAVVTTLVLCSVRDPEAVVREIARVLRPGGRYIFVEHVHAGEDQRFMRWQQETLDPLQQALADGCHLARDNDVLLSEAAGFRVRRFERLSVPSRWPCNVQVAGVLERA